MQNNNQKSICIFEAVEELREPYCVRSDSDAIIAEMNKLGWHGQVVLYSPDKAEQIEAQVSDKFCAYFSRYTPREPERARFHALLRNLSERAGLVGMSHPDMEAQFGNKDVLARLSKTGLVPADTFAYDTMEEMEVSFPQHLARGKRVLKENVGAYGSGVWLVHLSDDSVTLDNVSLDSEVRCTDASDNTVRYSSVGQVIKKCERCLDSGKEGKIVDMPFLPRIAEGEIRLVMIGAEPTYIVHKRPHDDKEVKFSTNPWCAKETFHDMNEFPEVTTLLKDKMPDLLQATGEGDFPLIWTADFIPMGHPGEHRYSLGEINCCFITLRLFLEKGTEALIAKEAVRRAAKQ